MKLIYGGKFKGDVDILPCDELTKHPNAVRFKEPDDMKKFSVLMNILSIITVVIVMVIFVLRSGFGNISLIGAMLPILTVLPHELLHAICFKHEVHLYWNISMAFVVGTETMSKDRFIFLCLLPNIVFGFIPFTLYLIFPQLNILGTMGCVCIAMGVGDFYNVFNALTQMPKGSRCFLEKFNSYWYMPEEI